MSGKFLSFLSVMVHELIIFMRIKKGNKERGNKTLLTSIIRINNFFTLKGRYPKRVGAEKIIAIP
jgi:hypothetical protein